MKYTIDDLEFDIERLIGELAALRAAKGHDYSSDEEDTFENLRLFGWQGILVRIGDKVMRLKSFSKKGLLKVKDEKVEDTMQDLINYALYLLIVYRQEKYWKVPSTAGTSRSDGNPLSTDNIPNCVPKY